MPLNSYELLHLMRKEGMKNRDIADITSVGTRKITHIYNGHSLPSNQVNFERCALESLSHHIDFPWSFASAIEMNTLRDIGRNRDHQRLLGSYGFSADMLIKSAIAEFAKPDFDAEKASSDLWGTAFIGFYFILAMRSLRIAAVSKNIYDTEWEHLVDGIGKLMASIDSDVNWAIIMRYKVAQNYFNTRWNALDGDERKSAETKTWIYETKIQEQLLRYNDLIPHDISAPFTAMAIASRFEDCSSYPGIQKRLAFADPRFSDPDSFSNRNFMKAYPWFDADFFSYSNWMEKNRMNVKEVS